MANARTETDSLKSISNSLKLLSLVGVNIGFGLFARLCMQIVLQAGQVLAFMETIYAIMLGRGTNMMLLANIFGLIVLLGQQILLIIVANMMWATLYKAVYNHYKQSKTKTLSNK